MANLPIVTFEDLTSLTTIVGVVTGITMYRVFEDLTSLTAIVGVVTGITMYRVFAGSLHRAVAVAPRNPGHAATDTVLVGGLLLIHGQDRSHHARGINL